MRAEREGPADAILFEATDKRDGLWRLEVVTYRERTFAQWRRWWRNDAGELLPTRDGVTFPPERLSELRQAVEAWEQQNALSGLPSAF